MTVPARGDDLVEGLHRLDDQQRSPVDDLAADLDEGLGAGLGPQIGGADHRRGHDAGMLGEIGDGGRGRAAGAAGTATRQPRSPASLRATVTLRATRTRRPPCSTSISVRSVSFRSWASSRIIARRRSWCLRSRSCQLAAMMSFQTVVLKSVRLSP